MIKARKHFISQGKLKNCNNKPRKFQFWRVMGQFQMADESWGILSDSGYLFTSFVGIHSIETTDGVKAYQIIVWKFSITFAFS